MKRTWRRRNYFIKKDLQGRFIFIFFFLVALGSLLFALIFSFLSSDTLTVVYRNYSLRIGKTPSILIGEFLRAYWYFIIVAGISVVGVSMFLTHRFAGPLYRFERSFEEMIRGNLNLDIRLRKRDEGKELARMMNEFNSLLSARIREMRDLTEDIEGSLSKAAQTASEESDRAALLVRAKEMNRRLKEILQGYTIRE